MYTMIISLIFPYFSRSKREDFLSGLGIAMTMINILVCIYYNVIVSWILNYLFAVITAQSWRWSRCLPENGWNTESRKEFPILGYLDVINYRLVWFADCQSDFNDRSCSPEKFYNFTCFPRQQWENITRVHTNDLTSATEEYFRSKKGELLRVLNNRHLTYKKYFSVTKKNLFVSSVSEISCFFPHRWHTERQ